MKTALHVRGTGLAKLRELAEALKNSPHVKVGVFGAATNSQRSGQAGGKKGIDAVGLAIVHEFGTDTIPSRSFLRATSDAKRIEWAAFQAKLLRLVAVGKMKLDQALGLMGERARRDIIRTIRAGIPPPLAPATVRRLNLPPYFRASPEFEVAAEPRKGSSKPLIDTGRLVQSISYQVNGGPIVQGTTATGLSKYAKKNTKGLHLRKRRR